MDIFVYIWIIVFLFIIAGAIFGTIRVAIPRRRFRRIFSFDPPIKSDGEEGIRLLQPDVGSVLIQQAQAIEQEQNTRSMNPTPDYKLSRMRKLRRMHAEFSQIRVSAERFGFEAKETTYAYIRDGEQAVDSPTD